MKKQSNLSIVAVAAATLFCSASAMADFYNGEGGNGTTTVSDGDNVLIAGNSDSSNTGTEGVMVTSNTGSGALGVDQAYVRVLSSGVATLSGATSVNIFAPLTTVDGALTVTGASTTAGISNTGDISNTGNITNGGTLGVTGATTLNGATAINATLDVTGATNINTTGTAATRIGTNGGNTTIGNASSTNAITGATNTITGTTNTIVGATSINASVNAATTINTGSSTGAVTIGNAANTSSLNSATNNIGANAFATTNNIGTGTAATSNNIGTGTAVTTNSLGNTNAGTSVTTRGGNSTSVVSNGVSSSTVTAGVSTLDGATGTTTGQMLIRNANGATVDANGKITSTGNTGASAALTLANGVGNVHGLVVTESQTTLSGGTQSSSMTLNDRAATFSNAQTGAPITVTGVANGSADFDAVNVRQFAGAIAAVTAAANIPAPEAGKASAFGVGLGNFMGKNALSLGLVHRTEKGPMLKFSVSGGLNEGGQTPTVGMGAGWSW